MIKIHIYILIIVILALSNVAYSAPASSEKRSSLVKRQLDCTCARIIRWDCCDVPELQDCPF
ncbi:13522_t:CDS:1, partial [Funneliformis caledonium]